MPDNEHTVGDDLRWKVVAIEGNVESNAVTIEDNLTAEEGSERIEQLKKRHQ